MLPEIQRKRTAACSIVFTALLGVAALGSATDHVSSYCGEGGPVDGESPSKSAMPRPEVSSNSSASQSEGAAPESTVTSAADTALTVTRPDSVVAVYFHRTFRCRKCLSMESCARKAITGNFARAIKDGSLRWRSVDFEQPAHAKQGKRYELGGSALVLSHWKDGEEATWTRMDELWDLIDEPGAMTESVREQIQRCLKGKCGHGEFSPPDTTKSPGEKGIRRI